MLAWLLVWGALALALAFPARAELAVEAALPAVDLAPPQARKLTIDDAATSPRAVWPRPGFVLDAAHGLTVNYVFSTAQTADGSVWIGGMGGLQRYDGVRLYDASPQGLGANGSLAAQRVDVQLLREEGGALLFNWGDLLVLHSLRGAPDRVSRVGGPGWQAAAGFDWRQVGQLAGSFCRLEGGSVLQVRWGADAALRRMDLASGRWHEVPGFDRVQAAASASALRCSGDWVYWIESAPRPRAVALNLRDGSVQVLAAPQTMARAVVDLPQNQGNLALIGARRLLVGQPDGLYVADFERGSSGLDPELTRRVRALLPDGAEGGGFRVISGAQPGQVWITRSGSRAVEYHWADPQRLEPVDTAMMLGHGLAGQTMIRTLAETRLGTSRTLWVGRGDWLQAISLGAPVIAESGRPLPDERGDASDELVSLCIGSDGTLWLADIMGHLSLVDSAQGSVMRRVRGSSSVSSLSCEGDREAWWLEGDTLVHARREGDGRLASWRYALPPGSTRGTDTITRLDDRTLVLQRPDRLMRVRLDPELRARVTTQPITPYASARFQSGAGGSALALVVEYKGERVWIYRSAQARLTPVQVVPALAGPLLDGAWIGPRRAVVTTHDGRTTVLEFSADLSQARSRALGTPASLEGRTLYDLVGNAATGLWGSTNDGLVRLDLGRGSWEPVGTARGVAWSDFNYHACWVDPQNQRLAFGALEGWTLVDLARYHGPQGVPRAVIDRAAAGRGAARAVAGRFTFDESDGLLRVQAAAAGNAVQRPALLEYRVDGIDGGWRRIEPVDTIEYVGLGAGRYEMQARFVSAGGAVGEVGRLAIEVRPPWWRSNPARTVYVAAGVGLAWTGWRRRRLAHERQHSHFRQIERSEQRLSLALVASASVLWDEVNGVVVRTAADWLGYSAAELSGEAARFEALIHPDDQARFREARRDCREGRLADMRLEYRLRHRDGGWIWVHDVGRVTPSREGCVRLTGAFHEITRIKSIEEELRSMAYEDGLTRLPNRRECYRQIDNALGRGSEPAAERLAVVFMDLDRFKHINDSMGHAFGDRLLLGVAAALRRCLPAGATAFRLGGDEFVILMRGLSAEAAVGVAQQVLGEVRAVSEIDGVELNISASLGVALYPEHGCERKDLLQYADAAMYEAKQAGRNLVKVFDMASAAALLERPHIEAALRQGVDRGEFEVVYQPKVDARAARCVGFEALLRWRNPRYGHVSLARTIDVLESCGLIDGVGHWVLRRACEDLLHCTAAMAAGATVAVNVSVRQLARPGFARRVVQLLAEVGLAPPRLELELTESIFAAGDPLVIEQLRQLRAEGVKVAIDDFGMGYSSLSYLGSLPIDTIKIDKFFVDHIDCDRRSADLCQAILTLGTSLELGIVAEGVERAEQAERLTRMDCSLMQGFLFSRPVPAEALPGWFGEAAAARCTVARAVAPEAGAPALAASDAATRRRLRLVTKE
ncbi:MAG: EAL domain-containing protein [Burkholderiales bacterium]|nr:EAL domain-containing protein [Burkholderiales bacterium]